MTDRHKGALPSEEIIGDTTGVRLARLETKMEGIERDRAADSVLMQRSGQQLADSCLRLEAFTVKTGAQIDTLSAKLAEHIAQDTEHFKLLALMRPEYEAAKEQRRWIGNVKGKVLVSVLVAAALFVIHSVMKAAVVAALKGGM